MAADDDRTALGWARPERRGARVPEAVAALVGALAVVGAALPAAGRDVARGRPYSWTRPPNYARCTDPRDSLQLTDGQRAPSDHIWLDRRTVGWEAQPGDVVGLCVDLGQTCAVDSVVLCTAWFPPAEVVPPSLFCAVGESPASLAWAGDLDARALTHTDSSRAARVVLRVPLHGARGRYVLVAALLQSRFLFADEIEVHGTPASRRLVAEARDAPAAHNAARRDLGPFGSTFGVAELAAAAAPQRRVWALRAALPGTDAPAGLPALEEEAARLASRARTWRSQGAAPIDVRQVDPWAATSPWSGPQARSGDTLELWPGAWGAAAIEIVCAAEAPVHLPLEIAPARTGAPHATLRLVVPVEARDGRWSGDALPLAGAGLEVRPGEVRQIWIDVAAEDAAAGSYEIGIGLGAYQVGIPVRVHDVRSASVRLGALDWTYPEKFALTRPEPEAAVRDNLEHGIDTWWLPAEAVPWPDPAAIDARGHLTRPPDFAACDRQLALHQARLARRVGFFWNFEVQRTDPSRGRFRHPYLSRKWRQAVAEWLDAWLAHLDALGYDRSRIAMQPFDETTDAAVGSLFRALHALRPDLPLALTITRAATPAELRALEPDLGIAILERCSLARHQDWIRRLASRGTEVWTYDVLEPSKATPPVAGYRWLAWEAWARGLVGCAFWSYGDAGERSADAWDDFDGDRCDFAVVYGRTGAPSVPAEPFTPSKRWQAFRIGMQEAALFEAALVRRPDWRDTVRRALAGSAPVDPESLRGGALRALR